MDKTRKKRLVRHSCRCLSAMNEIHCEIFKGKTMEKKYLTVPFKFEKSVVEDDEYYRFEGYASTYNNVDRGDDMVMRGAFSNTLKDRNPNTIKILYQHDPEKPLGVGERFKDDENGLFFAGMMPKQLSWARDTMALIKCGAIDSLSIGYIPVKYDYDDRGIRQLKEIDLYEVSPVVMPMNPKAVITASKKLDVDDVKKILTKRDFERCLRESGAFSVNAAIKLASYFVPRESASADEGLLKDFQKAIDHIKKL